MSRSLRSLVVVLALVAPCAAGLAAPIPVSTYSMPNGDGTAAGGNFNYWDAAYNGSGNRTTDGAALSGGTGKLTDGVASTQRWDAVSNLAGTGEYVGWRNGTTSNPTIQFTFAVGALIDRIDIWLDNSQVGGVFAPTAILIDGLSRAFTVPTVGSVGDVVFTGLGLTGTTHSIQFLQAGTNWTFVSEIAFASAAPNAVPEPGTVALLGLGVGALALARRRAR